MGKMFIIREEGIRIEPKIEIMYMKVGGATTEVLGENRGKLEYNGTDSYGGKAGIMMRYPIMMKGDRKIESIMEINYGKEFGGKGIVRYGGAEEQANMNMDRIECELGVNVQITKKAYAYLQGSYEKGSKVNAYGGNIGIRIGFNGLYEIKNTKVKK
jgi:outer membrane autotransporter protein